MRRIALTTMAALALAAPGAQAALLGEQPAAATGSYERLSNEATLSRWAYTNLTLKLRKSPSKSARSIGKLHFNTEDGRPEIYLALRQYTPAGGEPWVQVRIPGRPNGRKGWVPREGLGEFHLVRTQLVINRRTLRATLYKNGKRIFKAPVGVGKASTPTPGGKFWIREKLKGFGPVYGPLAFGTAAYSTKLSDWPGGGVVGVHGTNEPELVPGRPSHGCVRMRNSEIVRLARLLPVGTPLLII